MWAESNVYVNQKPCEQLIFSGGEVQIRIPEVSFRERPLFYITAYLNSSNDVLGLLLTIDAVKREYPFHWDSMTRILEIPYFPYARQDRVCSRGEALSASIMANLINELQFDQVILLDPHSQVTMALVNRATTLPVEFGSLKKYEYLVAPDLGAEKRVREHSVTKQIPMIQCTKKRDPKTGSIQGITVIDDVSFSLEDGESKRVLIVDDICDGGRTFIEVSKELYLRGIKHVDLFVTHGIFSQGRDVFDGFIEKIYCTNSRNQIKGLPSTTILEYRLNGFQMSAL